MDGKIGSEIAVVDNDQTLSPQLPSPQLTPVEEHLPGALDGSPSTVITNGSYESIERGLGKISTNESHASSDGLGLLQDGDFMIEPKSPGTKDRALSDPTQELDTAVSGIHEVSTRRSTVGSKAQTQSNEPQGVRRLSAAKMHELTSSPDSLPLFVALSAPEEERRENVPFPNGHTTGSGLGSQKGLLWDGKRAKQGTLRAAHKPTPLNLQPTVRSASSQSSNILRPRMSSRTASTPSNLGTRAQRQTQGQDSGLSRSQKQNEVNGNRQHGYSNTPKTSTRDGFPSPMPAILPLPPLSLPTFLQLELSTDRPSPLYLHRPSSSDFPYESSKVKFERLLNFLLLPPQLEQTILFGALACLDASLHIITILPLRFLKAVWMLIAWALRNAFKEVTDLANFIYPGVGRLWHRHRRKEGASASATPIPPEVVTETATPTPTPMPTHMPTPTIKYTTVSDKQDSDIVSGQPDVFSSSQPTRPVQHPRRKLAFAHKRTKSIPSLLQPNHKADILQGLLIVACSTILMRLDASRMYHMVRGQDVIKLYFIFNLLEVSDRLFGALGQDIMECLFSRETLERNPDGRSKVLRPLWMFVLALVYSVVHAVVLFYHVVTLNVAINSFDNSLITLLMSNQFVEIKGAVFKRFERENLFQLTCADIVERFQLWLMLLIIALRNIVEMGGLSISLGDFSGTSGPSGGYSSILNSSTNRIASILPSSFTFLPAFPAKVIVPFLFVLGSELIVDWVKHAYINKFNSVTPAIYGRFLDVLAKDYYSNAFAEQTLTKRLGLPVVPLSCLFIRASLQTYHMFLATNIPPPISSTLTSLSVESGESTPASTAVFTRLDEVFREALGRSTFGGASTASTGPWYSWTKDDVIAFATMLVFFLVLFLFLLAFKLVLGMVLLTFARSRYRGMKEREQQRVIVPDARRIGGWGVVEVDDEKRRWIYDDDPDALKTLKAKEANAKAKALKAGDKLDSVQRYSMVAKRIW